VHHSDYRWGLQVSDLFVRIDLYDNKPLGAVRLPRNYVADLRRIFPHAHSFPHARPYYYYSQRCNSDNKPSEPSVASYDLSSVLAHLWPTLFILDLIRNVAILKLDSLSAPRTHCAINIPGVIRSRTIKIMFRHMSFSGRPGM
jgi:hypothetical protein